MRPTTAILALFAITAAAGAQIPDASLATGRKFAPFVISLKPSVQMSPLPPWMPSPPIVHAETATVELPVPSLWQSPSADFYALTVVFDDHGDGGPTVEWRSSSGVTQTISPGVGEFGPALGLNARTVLLPRDLTKDGGTVLLSYYGKFDALVSAALRPARENILAVLGGHGDPALVDEAMRVFERQDVSGLRTPPLTGDVRSGPVVEAELSAAVEELTDEIEFVIPISGDVEGTMFRLEILGLDLESALEVRVNGVRVGHASLAPFRLDDPALVSEPSGRNSLAGWRQATLYVPPRLWVPGDNSLVIRLKRSEFDAGRAVYIRNVSLHVRFGASAQPPASQPQPLDDSLAEPPAVQVPPAEQPLPEIVTSRP